MPAHMRQRTVDIDFTLRRVFGKNSFRCLLYLRGVVALLLTIDRPVQREVIVAALDGHDVFLQAATSFGKSLCFQLPAVVDFGSKMRSLFSRILLMVMIKQLRSSFHLCSP